MTTRRVAPRRHAHTATLSAAARARCAWSTSKFVQRQLIRRSAHPQDGRRRVAALGGDGASARRPDAARFEFAMGAGRVHGKCALMCPQSHCASPLVCAGILVAILYGCGCLGDGKSQGTRGAPGSGSRGYVRNPEVSAPLICAHTFHCPRQSAPAFPHLP